VDPYWELPDAPPGLAGESRVKQAQICQEYLLLPTGIGRGHPIYMTKLRRRPVVDLELVAVHPVVLHLVAVHPAVTVVAVHPGAVALHPEAVAVHPEAVAVHPEAVAVHPEAVAVHPEVGNESQTRDRLARKTGIGEATFIASKFRRASFWEPVSQWFFARS
jgi:hypothetical protein